MKKFAVAHMCLIDNNLQIEIVEARDWRSALGRTFIDSALTMASLSKDLEKAKEEAFNQDWMFAVTEVK